MHACNVKEKYCYNHCCIILYQIQLCSVMIVFSIMIMLIKWNMKVKNLLMILACGYLLFCQLLSKFCYDGWCCYMKYEKILELKSIYQFIRLGNMFKMPKV